MSRKKTHEEFISELQLLNPNYTVLGVYDGGAEHIECQCNICNNKWSPRALDLLYGKGCPVCSNKRSADKRRKSNEEFLSELRKVTTTIIPLEEYKGALVKIKVKCTKCNREWFVEPHSLLQGKGCNVCSSKEAGVKIRKSHEQFINEMREKYPTITVNSIYTTMQDNINFTCSICGNTLDRKAADIFYNGGCPICNSMNLPQRQPKSLEQFLIDLYKINQDIEYIDGYTKASDHVHVKCKICGHEWSPVGTSLTSGIGCPVCCMSHGERRIQRFLQNHNVLYEPQKTFNDLLGVGGGLLSYDFYLPDFNTLIEYQGEYHDGKGNNQTEDGFLKQQEHDRRKKLYADSHNIYLLEIWYPDYNNIEDILITYLTQQNDLYFKNPVTTKVI